ncbi:MAG: PPC domain-containing DNA-binding protein [Promethearchaeota archaeon]
MKSIITESSGRVIIARLAENADVIESIKELVKKKKIKGGIIKGIGALKKATLKFFNSEKKEYEEEEYNEPLEVSSLLGNIAWKDNEPFPHVHINLGRKDHSVIGGHCGSPSIVCPTLEIYIFETDETIKRNYDKKWDLNLLDL